MPFSTGPPYSGSYRYFVDPVDTRIAILQEFSENEYKTISKMRFRTAKVVDVLFIDNFTITTTDDNRVYMGMKVDDPTKAYNSMINDTMYKNRVIMVSGCHIIVSQCTSTMFGEIKQADDIAFYYDRQCNVCFKKAGGYYILSPPVWPNLEADTEISGFNSMITSV